MPAATRLEDEPPTRPTEQEDRRRALVKHITRRYPTAIITVAEMAAELAISKSTLKRRISSSQFPVRTFVLGQKRVADKREFAEYFADLVLASRERRPYPLAPP